MVHNKYTVGDEAMGKHLINPLDEGNSGHSLSFSYAQEQVAMQLRASHISPRHAPSFESNFDEACISFVGHFLDFVAPAFSSAFISSIWTFIQKPASCKETAQYFLFLVHSTSSMTLDIVTSHKL